MPTPNGYHDRFTSEKGWKKLLFKVDRPLQSAELNELQSVIQEEHTQLASSFYKAGAAVSGLSLSLVFASEYPDFATGVDYTVGQHVLNNNNGYVCLANNTSVNVSDLSNVALWAPSTGYASISEGKLYALGVIHLVSAGQLEILGTGSERIGVLITPVVVTALDDPDLLDPAIGYEGHLWEGADRLTYSYAYALNDPLSVVIAEIVDGQIDQMYQQVRPQIEPVLKVLATRTTDQSGSFTVNPYTVEIKELDADNPNRYNKLKMILRNGSAYVQGWSVRNTTFYMDFDKALDRQTVSDEPHLYLAAGAKEFDLINIPSFEVNSISAIVEKQQSLTRTSPANGSDLIPAAFTPLYAINSVTQGPTSFTVGDDFIRSGDSVSWAPGGAEPSIGSTYTVNFQYVRQLTIAKRVLTPVTAQSVVRSALSYDAITPAVGATNMQIKTVSEVKMGSTVYTLNTDYTVSQYNGRILWVSGHGPTVGHTYTVTYEYWNHAIEGDFVSRNSFFEANGTTNVYYELPTTTMSNLDINFTTTITLDTNVVKDMVNNTHLNITYQFAMPRVDTLAVDNRGVISLVKGVSARMPAAPSISDNQMAIAILMLDADTTSSSIKIKYIDNQRMTMVELRTMLRMVKDLQYNQAVFQLHQEAMNKDLPTDKKAVWSDSFATPLFGDITNPDFAVTFDFIGRTLTLPQETEQYELNAVSGTTAVAINNYFMVPYTHEMYMVQPYATTTIQVNAYTRVNTRSTVRCDPPVDRWTERTTQKIEVQGQLITLPPKFIQNGEVIDISRNPGIPTEFWNTLPVDNPQQTWGDMSTRSNRTITNFDTTVKTNNWDEISSQIVVTPIHTARIIDLDISGASWLPNEDNIAVYFDGTRVKPTPLIPSVIGTNEWTVKADSAGNFHCSISVPPNSKSGTHRIDVSGEGAENGAGSRASTTFTSEGKLETTLVHVTHQTSKQAEIEVSEWTVDPVAQTFFAVRSSFVTKLDVFFVSKDASMPVWVEIRNVQNGVPGKEILGASPRLTPAQVSISNNGTVATQFVFENPVYVQKGKEYCFVVISDSEQYSIFISKTGDLDPINGYVNENPNLGVLLTSANLSTWSPMQNADIKFVLYNAKFTAQTAVINYGQTTFLQAMSRFVMSCSYADPNQETSVRFQYSLDNAHWFECAPILENNIYEQFTNIYLRAILTTSNDRLVSPIVYNDGALEGLRWLPTGEYISRQVTTNADNSRFLHVWYDAKNLDAITTTVPSITIDSVDHAMTEVIEDRIDYGDGWIEQHFMYDHTVGFSNAILHVNMTTNNVTLEPRLTRARMIFSGL